MTQIARYVIYTIMERKNVKLISPSYKWNLITADPDDNKFVDCAIAANAKFIVTEDHHFNVLKEIDFPSVDVINIDDFLKEVMSQVLNVTKSNVTRSRLSESLMLA